MIYFNSSNGKLSGIKPGSLKQAIIKFKNPIKYEKQTINKLKIEITFLKDKFSISIILSLKKKNFNIQYNEAFNAKIEKLKAKIPVN